MAASELGEPRRTESCHRRVIDEPSMSRWGEPASDPLVTGRVGGWGWRRAGERGATGPKIMSKLRHRYRRGLHFGPEIVLGIKDPGLKPPK